MAHSRHIVHFLDDLSMGGVTRALKNFEHTQLAELGRHHVVDIASDWQKARTRDDIAIVHFTVSWRKINWLLRLRAFGRYKRVILIEHSYTEGFETHEVDTLKRFRLMLKCAYSCVDTVVAVSQTQRQWILKHDLAPAYKVSAIPQSRDCGALLDIAPVARTNGPLRIGAFGRFHKQKGFDLLITAMARLPHRLATLKLAGSGPDLDRLKAQSADLNCVEFCDAFSTPGPFLDGCDIVAIPSRWEAFGLVGTEARTAARPLLAARIDGLCDQLDASSFSHAPDNVGSIVRAIYKAADADNLTERGLFARQQVMGEFDTMLTAWHRLLTI